VVLGGDVGLASVTMTVGSGPFGHRPAGEFNFEVPRRGVEYLEPFPRRIRGFAGGDAVVDSVRAKMLHVQRSLPVWVFPAEDVRLDRLADRDAWTYSEGLAKGMIGVRWDAVDRWFEEEEEVIIHVRDPYHRIELRETSRLVTVELDGVTLAQSSGPLALFEAALPTRWYMPLEDVRAELIANSAVRTGCAYKGWAEYRDVRVASRIEPFLAWQYSQPLRGMERIKGLVCFFNERIDLRVDNELQERPTTLYSTTKWVEEEWAHDTSARASRTPIAAGGEDS
jgi:uncharacterized protein (DUF427 family)